MEVVLKSTSSFVCLSPYKEKKIKQKLEGQY